jgi:hypothetical protein
MLFKLLAGSPCAALRRDVTKSRRNVSNFRNYISHDVNTFYQKEVVFSSTDLEFF